MNRLFYLLASVVLVSGCRENMTIAQLNDFINDEKNGLHKVREIDGLIADVKLFVPDMPDSAEKGNLFSDSALFFLCDLSLKDKGDLFSVSGNWDGDPKMYYAFRFQENIRMAQKDEEIPCSYFHHIETYQLSGRKRFLLGFDLAGITDDLVLEIEPKPAATGKIKFRFRKEDIQQLKNIELSHG